MNIRQLIEDRVARNPAKVYLYFEDQQVTYADFNAQINRVANSLWNAGIRKGDRFAIMLPNCPEFLYVWFGLNKIGALEVPINNSLKGEEVKYILKHSEAKGIVIHSDYLALLEGIRAELPQLKHVVVFGKTAGLVGVVPYESWLNSSSSEPPVVEIAEDDPAGIIYTSGTTGLPKGVLLSHRGWVMTGESYAFTVGIKADDRVMTPNPLFHANAQCYSTMGSLAAGASLIVIKRFSQSEILEQTRRYGATVLVLVQAVTPWVWSRPVKPDDKDNPVRTVVAGNWPPDIYKKFEERFGVKNQTIYSQTEATMAIMGPREGTQPRKAGGIGVPMEHPDPSVKNEVKIADEKGEEVPSGQTGEILIKNPAVMLEYYKDPEKTAETKRNGWIYTGDTGYRDETGYIFFVGRKKQLIRRRGELISPVEIEEVINKHPKVQESAVIGIPSGLGVGEEEIKVYVMAKPGETVTPEEICSWCGEKLAAFKVPKYIEFRTEFPRSSIGRIQKEALKAEKKDPREGCYERK
ncbi:MAG: AMP-binding protein [Chloroflexi bacterium]|nr:AMP-binding protein [Chloroflexota bacterium]